MKWELDNESYWSGLIANFIFVIIMSLQSMSSKDEKPIGKDLEVILTIDEVSARMHGCMYECINF